MGFRIRDILPRGESIVASTGSALAAVLLIALGATTWWAMRIQREAMIGARHEATRDVADLMEASARSMMAAGELSALRHLVSDLSRIHDLDTCRISLPDGQVVADGDPARVSLVELPRSWTQGASAVVDTEADVSEGLAIRRSLLIPGRGVATLEIGAAEPVVVSALQKIQIGAGIVAALSLLALLLVYRRARARMAAASVICEAIQALHREEATEADAMISDDFGEIAAGWNSLLRIRAQQRTDAARQRTREFLDSRSNQHSEFISALDGMWNGVLLIGADRRARLANGAAAVMLQVDRDELLGADLDQLLTPEITAAIDAVLSGGTPPTPTCMMERENETARDYLRFTTRRVRHDDRIQALVTIEDVTQQRVSDEARQSFLAQVAHELRTPLTNIRLYVNMAVEDGEQDPEVHANCFNVINQEARRLERIVSDMLSVSEIEAGSLRLVRNDVPLAEILEEIERDYQAQAAEKSITLRFNLPKKFPIIDGDRDKLVLVLHNLLGNALKYTPEQGTVELNATADEERVVIEVVDTGIGIGPDDAKRVFEKFYRANDPRIESITGTGLGLALTREIIILHGGDISVESEIDRGSTFRLTLPASRKAA